MRLRFLLLTGCMAGFLAVPAEAQTAQRFSVQGSVLGASFGGKVFEASGMTFDPGSGFELQFRFNPSAFSVGAGVQYTSHAVQLTGVSGVDINIEFAGVFVEPRYVIFIGSERVAPYVAARLMRLVSTLSVPSISFEEEYDAWGYNVGGGILVAAGSRMNLDIGLTAGGTTFVYEDPNADPESGSGVVFRVGLALGI